MQLALELPPAPKLVRQSAFGGADDEAAAPLPRDVPGNPPAIALPDTCDLAADFGTPQGGPGGWGDDGWGSD